MNTVLLKTDYWNGTGTAMAPQKIPYTPRQNEFSKDCRDVIHRAELFSVSPDETNPMNINNSRDEETRLRLLKVLDSSETEWTQRGLADQLGISLGKTNYCVRELARAGFIRIDRFRGSNNKLACTYALTPSGIEEQFRLLVHFLSRKLREYELLRKEIAEINQELVKHGSKRLEANEIPEIKSPRSLGRGSG